MTDFWMQCSSESKDDQVPINRYCSVLLIIEMTWEINRLFDQLSLDSFVGSTACLHIIWQMTIILCILLRTLPPIMLSYCLHTYLWTDPGPTSEVRHLEQGLHHGGTHLQAPTSARHQAARSALYCHGNVRYVVQCLSLWCGVVWSCVVLCYTSWHCAWTTS
jgi:hypothetical protein